VNLPAQLLPQIFRTFLRSLHGNPFSCITDKAANVVPPLDVTRSLNTAGVSLLLRANSDAPTKVPTAS